jgi:hypothetical protein
MSRSVPRFSSYGSAGNGGMGKDQREKVVTRVLGNIIVGGRYMPIADTFYWRMRHAADSRLTFLVEVFYEGDNHIDDVPVGPLWNVTPRAVNRETGRISNLQDIFSADRALPSGEEIATMAEDLVGRFVGHNGDTYNVNGFWFVQASWRPNTEIDDVELEGLFARCDLMTTPTVLSALAPI